MGYKEKPYLKLYKVINGSFSFVAVIDDYQDFSTETKLYEAGNFTCTINLNIPNANKFERGMFIWVDGAFWEITTITDSIGSDGKGSQIRQITGYDARYILKRRIIRNMNAEGKYEFYAKGELCLRNLVYDQCGLGTVEKRRLPIINTIPLAVDAVGEIYALSSGYENLYEVCKTIATQSAFGWRIDFDGTNLTLVCFTGEDKSNTVQFSTDMDSLADGTYTDTADSYANCIYVGGKGQNAEQEIYEGEQDGAEGLSRYEAYDSNSDLTTEDEYEAEALSMLTQYAQTVTLSGNGLAKCPYEFKNQYNVGDYITVSFSGHKAKVQILSVTQNWAWNNYSLSFEFGKPQNTLDEQLQLLLKKVQSGEKPRTTDSVFWYTIPTDTEQSKDEVKYNTIGFIGDCGAGGSTFQLYLDNEKNGSKSYHIYFKELAGKTLTLTTGRAGAHDLTVSTGTYVLIVYVDENGNITEQGTTTTNSVVQGNTQPVTSDAVANAIQQVASPQWEIDTTVKIYDTKYCVNERPSTCYRRDEGGLIHYIIDSIGTTAISANDGRFFHFDPSIINLSNMVSGTVSVGRKTNSGLPIVFWVISTTQTLECWNGARVWNEGSGPIASNCHVYFDFFMPKTV